MILLNFVAVKHAAGPLKSGASGGGALLRCVATLGAYTSKENIHALQYIKFVRVCQDFSEDLLVFCAGGEDGAWRRCRCVKKNLTNRRKRIKIDVTQGHEKWRT